MAHELTILTGWAQALVEAMAYAPESVETVLANARAGSPWRKEFGIAEPSRSLCEAMYFMGREVCSSGVAPTLGELHVWCQGDRSGEHELEKLVRRVLRPTIEPLRARQAKKAGRLGQSIEPDLRANSVSPMPPPLKTASGSR